MEKIPYPFDIAADHGQHSSGLPIFTFDQKRSSVVISYPPKEHARDGLLEPGRKACRVRVGWSIILRPILVLANTD